MEELNAYYTVWEVITHQECNHSALEAGKLTPQEAFDKDAVNTPLDFVSKEVLDEAFLVRSRRKVHKDGTFSLYGKMYEVENYNLRGEKIDVYYLPSTGNIVKVKFKDVPDSGAHLLKIGEDVDFRLRNKMNEDALEKERDDTPSDSGSRVLEMCRREYEKKYPETNVFDYEKKEKRVETEDEGPKPSINFSRLNEKEERR